MRYHIFNIVQNDESGMLGFQFEGRRWADPLGGMAAIHDVLEHMRDDDGSVEGELMAMGASFLVRGEEFYAISGSYNTSPGYHWSAELAEQIRYMDDSGRRTLRDPGKVPLGDDNVTAWTDEAIEEARRNWLSENDDMELPAWLAPGPESFKIHGWVRKGYMRAVRRYRKLNPFNGFLAQTFRTAEKELDAILRRADEGQRVSVGFDFSTGQCVVHDLEYTHARR